MVGAPVEQTVSEVFDLILSDEAVLKVLENKGLKPHQIEIVLRQVQEDLQNWKTRMEGKGVTVANSLHIFRDQVIELSLKDIRAQVAGSLVQEVYPRVLAD